MPAPVEAEVGPQAGEAPIHVSARDDSSSLLPITARQSELFPGTAAAGMATIRVLRLADALPAAEIAARAESRRGRRSYGVGMWRRRSIAKALHVGGPPSGLWVGCGIGKIAAGAPLLQGRWL